MAVGIAIRGVRLCDLLFGPGVSGRLGRCPFLLQLRGRERCPARLVLLSGRGEDGARLAEQAVEASGVEWTIVRSSWFCQNFSENFLLESVLGGEVTFPAGDVGEPFIDTGDIADVAVAALTEEGHAGQAWEVTGPRLLTLAEASRKLPK
jgi:hypothetical protein